MFKKSTAYAIIVVFLFSIFSAENVYASQIGISINDRPVHFTPESGEPFVDQTNRVLSSGSLKWATDTRIPTKTAWYP